MCGGADGTGGDGLLAAAHDHGRRRAGRGQRPDGGWLRRRAAGTVGPGDHPAGGRPGGGARAARHRGLAGHPAGRRPDLGVHDRDQRPARRRRGPQGVDAGRAATASRRTASARTAAAPAPSSGARRFLAGERQADAGPRPGRDPHRGGAVAPQPDPRHRPAGSPASTCSSCAPAPAGRRAVPYVVSSPSARGTVALVAPVTTWQAYNEWGGYSLYAGPAGDRRSWAVSYDRPFNLATGANDYRTAAIPDRGRAERLHALGIPLSYYANVDLDRGPGRPRRCPRLRVDGARRVLDARRCARPSSGPATAAPTWPSSAPTPCTGGSGSTAGCRPATGPTRPRPAARPAARRRRPRSSATCRRPNPEQTLTGMMYECYPVDADFVVARRTWWGFRGTGRPAR